MLNTLARVLNNIHEHSRLFPGRLGLEVGKTGNSSSIRHFEPLFLAHLCTVCNYEGMDRRYKFARIQCTRFYGERTSDEQETPRNVVGTRATR